MEEFDIDKLINEKVKVSKNDIDNLLDDLISQIQISKRNISKHPGIAHISLQNIIYKTKNLHKYIEILKETPLEE